MSTLARLKSDIFPKAVKEGRFGENNVRFIEFKEDPNFRSEDQFQSNVYFGDVIMETIAGGQFTQSVVIKTQAENLDHVAEYVCVLENEVMFQNEFLFYNDILPLLQNCDSTGMVFKMFPKLFYGSATTGKSELGDNILIFENVQKFGFKLAESRAFLDYDHIKLTLEWIARFHSLALVCKRKYPGTLQEISSRIKEALWTEDRLVTNPNAFFIENCKRGVLPLLDDPHYKDKLEDLLAVVEETDILAAKIVAPVEPLAVICHGDFCRNNIFYKYNSAGVPYEMIIFDLATIRYCSPAIDTSFFLFMHTSPEMRSTHWDYILQTYHSALTSNPDLDPRDTPSLADVTTDFQRRGFYGYIHSSYWLPSMQMEKGSLNEWWNERVEEQIKACVSTGGEEATSFVVQMVKHMIEKKFDFKYIKNLKLTE